MKEFDDCFHTLLNTPVPSTNAPRHLNEADVQKPHFSYGSSNLVEFALLRQNAIVTEMGNSEKNGQIETEAETEIGKAVQHNMQMKSRSAEWIDLPTALQGPSHVAEFLIKKLQNERSKPGKEPYRLNAEQLQLTALFVEILDKAFLNRSEPSEPWLNSAEVLATIVTDGGGGCGKTTLAVEVLLPLLEAYYRPEGVLRRAPSNKPARLIGGRTVHSGIGIKPENSMRSAALVFKDVRTRQKLALTTENAGVVYIDESSQLQGELNHAQHCG